MELSNENLIEEEVSSANPDRAGIRIMNVRTAAEKVRKAAESGGNIYETSEVTKTTSQAVKDLNQDKTELFPEKEGVVEEMETQSDQDAKVAEKKNGSPDKKMKKIMGMHPFAFVIVSAAVIAGGVLIYKKYIKKS